MKLIVVSGRSGSGKTISLRLLEDMGYYCVDNLPPDLLLSLTDHLHAQHKHIAVSIDARNIQNAHKPFHETLQEAKQQGQHWEVLYLDASDAVLLQRFSETRRKHPLTTQTVSLEEAIKQEKTLLESIANQADLQIDTSHLSTQQCQQILRERVVARSSGVLSILFKSFGYKHGIPTDADYVFDVRCLPNPYWDLKLRPYNGLDAPVQAFLCDQDAFKQMLNDIQRFLSNWIPQFMQDNRCYLTVAIGCTGGRHRSVYLAQQLAESWDSPGTQVQVRHRDLGPW